MGLVTQAGIGSGIDAEAIIEALINAEKFPKEASFVRLEQQSNSTISGLGKLKSALSDLQDSALNLNQANFNTRSATSSDSNQIVAIAKPLSTEGNFDVTIVNTAEVTQFTTGTIAGDSSTVLGNGNLSFLNANGDSFIIAVGALDTLADIVSSINSASDNFGISATIVNGDTGAKILYRGDDTGALNDFTVTNDNANLAPISDGNGGVLVKDTTAIDAQITIAGLTITSDSNNFIDPVLGVDLTLDPNAVAGILNIIVVKDPTTVKENIQQFVEDYNQFISVANELGSSVVGSPGELFGDSTLRNITSQIKSIVSNTVASSPAGTSSLSAIGIITERDGTITLDTSILDSRLASNFNGVGNLFFASDGIGTFLETAINPLTEFSGLLDKRTDSMQEILKRVDDDRESLDFRINQLELSLRYKFAAMDTLVSQFNFTGRFLEQQFTLFSNNKN